MTPTRIKFLITLASAIKNGSVKKISQAVKFAKQEFGKVDDDFLNDIINVFKKEGKTKKGDVVPIKKKPLSEADQDIADIQKSIDDLDAVEAEADASSILENRTRDIEKGDVVDDVDDLETSINRLKKDIKEAAEELKKTTIKPEGIMKEIMKGQEVMRDLHKEGQVRTAVRWFMKQEADAGRLKLSADDLDSLTLYGQTKASDPIEIFRRYFGEDALEEADRIADVFEQGKSFNHYAELLRKHADPKFLVPKTKGMGQYDESVVAGEKIRKALEEEAKQKKILEDWKPDREPSAHGGIAGQLHLNRTGYRIGGAIKTFKLAKKFRESPEYKKFIEMLFIKASNMIRQGKGMFKNLTESQRIKQHDNLTKEVTNFQKTGELPEGAHQYFGMNPEVAYAETLQKVSKPKIDFSDPRVKTALEKANQKGTALSDAAKTMGYDMSKQKDYFSFEEAISGGMEGWPKEVREQIIRAKYGDVVDTKLLNQMIADTDPQHLAVTMGTVEEGLKMQEMGMSADEIVETIQASLKRKPSAEGGRVGMAKGGLPNILKL